MSLYFGVGWNLGLVSAASSSYHLKWLPAAAHTPANPDSQRDHRLMGHKALSVVPHVVIVVAEVRVIPVVGVRIDHVVSLVAGSK